jgi:RNase P/RNase MRP subunit p29
LEIYCVKEIRGKIAITSDTVVKETEKMYMVTRLDYKSQIPKKIINMPVMSFGGCSVYCLDPIEGKAVYREYLDGRIADKQKSIETYKALQRQCV